MSASTQSKVFLQEMEQSDCSCVPSPVSLSMEKISCKASPSERAGHSLTHIVLPAPDDIKGGQDEEYVVLIGGSNIRHEHFNDVWLFHKNSETWFPLRRGNHKTQTEQPERSSHAAVCQPVISSTRLVDGACSQSAEDCTVDTGAGVGRVLVCGGHRVGLVRHEGEMMPQVTHLQDMYVLELWRTGEHPQSVQTAWTKLQPKLKGVSFTSSAVAWRFNDEVFLFGGASEHGPSNLVLRLDSAGTELQAICVEGAAPEAMEMCGSAYHDGKLTVWGGRGFEGVHSLAYTLDCITWQWTLLGKSPKMCGTSSAMLHINQESYLLSLGGCTEETLVSDVLLSQSIARSNPFSMSLCAQCKGITGWTKVDTLEDPQQATSESLFYHIAAASVSQTDGTILQFGGTSGDRYFNHTILLSAE